jgi:hypothetical protein
MTTKSIKKTIKQKTYKERMAMGCMVSVFLKKDDKKHKEEA